VTQAQDFADLSQAYSAGNVALSNRNFIVDGAFEQWSSASGIPVAIPAGGYSNLVMHGAAVGAAGVGTILHGVAGIGPVGRLGWPRGGLNYRCWQQTTASTGTIAARTGPLTWARVEDVNLLENGSWTFSITLCNGGAVPITISQVYIVQNFGSGGSPSANVFTTYPVNWVLPVGGWYRYSVRLDIPPISSYTLGTNGPSTSWTQIAVQYPVASLFTINDGFWQLEPCSPLAPAAGWPTAFEYRGQAAEAARVERYYEVTNNCFATGMVNTTTNAWVLSRYRTAKRIIPSAVPSGVFNVLMASTGNQVLAAANINPVPNIDSVLYSLTITGGVAGQAIIMTNSGGSPVPQVTFDARL
jgi:hypothetical protein